MTSLARQSHKQTEAEYYCVLWAAVDRLLAGTQTCHALLLKAVSTQGQAAFLSCH